MAQPLRIDRRPSGTGQDGPDRDGPGGDGPGTPDARALDARTLRRARMALAVLLLALLFLGLRGGLPRLALDGPYHRDVAAICGSLELVLGALLAALMVRRARAPREAVLAARLRTVLSYVTGAGLIGVPIIYLLSRNIRIHGKPRRLPPPGRVRIRGHSARAATGTADARVFVIIVLALLAAAVICLLIIFIPRIRRAFAQRRGVVIDVELTAEDPDGAGTGLRAAVESGRSAFRLLDDARAAIIACYVAMEDSLAEAGTARAAAETPDELLARAAAAGLVHGEAAARLTALFYEARFSSHPLPPAYRDTAERALSALAADLARAAGQRRREHAEQPGQPGTEQPGQPGTAQPGQPGVAQPGQPGAVEPRS
jgi:Domain of unknown function (DUF4129)